MSHIYNKDLQHALDSINEALNFQKVQMSANLKIKQIINFCFQDNQVLKDFANKLTNKVEPQVNTFQNAAASSRKHF